MAENDEVRLAIDRILEQHFHEDEPSPLLEPERDDEIRDDCIMVAEALKAHLAHPPLTRERVAAAAKQLYEEGFVTGDLRRGFDDAVVDRLCRLLGVVEGE